jgi:autophagy-related protein 9
VYFSSLYSYYYHRGFSPILAKGVVELTGLFFTLILSVFLFSMVDWTELAGCIDESTCHAHFSSYIHPNPFAASHRTSWTFVVLGYALLFGSYGMFATWTFLHTLRRAAAAQWVFENQIGISRRKLEGGAVDWDADVVAKLRDLQRSGQYRVAIHQHSDHLDALVVANRIMRKDNFLIAMLNCGVLDLSVPLFKDRTFFCSSIEVCVENARFPALYSFGLCCSVANFCSLYLSPQWVLHFAVLNFLFNHKYQIRPAFYLDPASLRRRFIVCGIAHAVFLPFLLFFLTLHFGFQNAYDWKSTKRYLGPRDWSLHSRWLFREFNELPHHFERRLAPSYRATEEYFRLFGQSEATAAIGRILVFVGGSLGAVLFLFAAINDAILLHVKIADWNLLWYAGVVGVVYSIGKSMLPAEESASAPRNVRNLFAEMDAALLNIAKHTHYYLETWKGRGSDVATTSAVSSMFKFKANLFAMEVASVIVAPYVLCVSLARCAEGICEFVFSVKEDIIGAGEVCGFATFDFDKYSDEAWEGRTLGATTLPSEQKSRTSLAESILQTGNVARTATYVSRPRTRHGKMEKSFFSFKVRSANTISMQNCELLLLLTALALHRHPILIGNARHQDKALSIESSSTNAKRLKPTAASSSSISKLLLVNLISWPG